MVKKRPLVLANDPVEVDTAEEEVLLVVLTVDVVKVALEVLVVLTDEVVLTEVVLIEVVLAEDVVGLEVVTGTEVVLDVGFADVVATPDQH